MSKQESHADTIIRNHMIWSMGAGFIPVPIADFFAVSAVQLDMIRQLCKVYDVDFKQTQGKAVITALTGSSLARLGTRAIKLIPGVGTVLGGVSLAILSGASTYALGEVFKTHFETGGTFLDFDVERLKKYYSEKFEKGKEIAAEVQNNKEYKESDFSQTDVVTQIQRIAKLRDEGMITEEEFSELKKKIISGS
jgi:uncharacterized protein (DUF697 family)